MQLTRRLLVTLGLPLAVALLGSELLLPGIPPELARGASGSHANLSVFALGILPITTAYWIVEVVAFLVPRWSRLRHGNPDGRARLERASRVLAVVLALVQGLGMAMSLQAIGRTEEGPTGVDFTISLPIVMVTLTAGVCLLFVLARFITQQGLMNGFVALFGVSLAVDVVRGTVKGIGLLGPGLPDAPWGLGAGELARVVFAVTAVAVASVLVVRRAGDVPAGPPETEPGAPYRQARTLAVHPWIPVPASSFQAYFFATSLLMLPVSIAAFGVPGLSALRDWSNVVAGPAFLPIALAATTLAMFVFATVMHRPSEMGDLAVRLGAKEDASVRAQAGAALRAALLPSLLFFVVVILAGAASPAGSTSIVLLVVIVVDLVHAIGVAARKGDLAVVWEERRAPAVPPLRAALAADGIATETRGMGFLSLWQVFAPYAPAQILVRKQDAERATQKLRHLLLGEAAPTAPEAGPGAPAETTRPPGWSPRKLAVGLAACAAVAAGAWACPKQWGPPPPVGPRANLEVVAVDDTIDPLAKVPDESIPDGSGIAVFSESVPVGAGQQALSHYARITLRRGESRASAVARLQSWLAPLPLPPAARFGFQDVTDYDDDTMRSTLVGVRTYVLEGEAILRTQDVEDAQATAPSQEGIPQVAVEVVFSPKGGERFEAFTRRWQSRRAAIVLDGQINVAPVIRSVIAGGRITVSLGRGDPVTQAAEAKRLARALRGR